jgi:hypothetical protein
MDAYTFKNPDLQVPKLSGRGLPYRRFDARQRACLAANAHDELIIKPSIHWLARAFQVSRMYIALALKLSPERRQAIIEGRDTTSFITLLKANIPDTELITFVRTIGVSRVLDAAVVVEAAE